MEVNTLNACSFLQPLIVNKYEQINSKYDYNFDNNILNMFNYSLKMYTNFINDNNYNPSIIEDAIFKYYMSEKIIEKYSYDTKIKNCILIASFLSTLYDLDSNIKINDFILGSFDEKNMIIDMINLIYQNNTIVEEYMLIPKYITIIDKIGRPGIYRFINYLKQSNNNYNLYNEMMTYCNIILNYTFNINQINHLYNLRIKEVKKLYEFVKTKDNISIKDILSFID